MKRLKKSDMYMPDVVTPELCTASQKEEKAIQQMRELLKEGSVSSEF